MTRSSIKKYETKQKPGVVSSLSRSNQCATNEIQKCLSHSLTVKNKLCSGLGSFVDWDLIFVDSEAHARRLIPFKNNDQTNTGRKCPCNTKDRLAAQTAVACRFAYGAPYGRVYICFKNSVLDVFTEFAKKMKQIFWIPDYHTTNEGTAGNKHNNCTFTDSFPRWAFAFGRTHTVRPHVSSNRDSVSEMWKNRFYSKLERSRQTQPLWPSLVNIFLQYAAVLR